MVVLTVPYFQSKEKYKAGAVDSEAFTGIDKFAKRSVGVPCMLQSGSDHLVEETCGPVVAKNGHGDPGVGGAELDK